MSLKGDVQVQRRFQRSIRLDTDLDDPQALQGFVCPPTFAHALTTLSQQVKDVGYGAFTWTGPFGGGKSSLAVVLSALLSAPGVQRKRAMSAVGSPAKDIVDALKPGRLGYRSLAIVGRKQDCAELIADALKRDGLIRKPIDTQSDNGAALLETLVRIAKRPKHAGLVVFIDEMGKVLEAAAQGRGDLHFLQELAEIASRSQHRLIVIGILHQAFGEYTSRLARRTRDEWMKVQGRFVDIPLATVADEQLALLSHAIAAPKPPKACQAPARTLAAIIKDQRATNDKKLAAYLAGCWPLHPVTACLLGPYSRRRFGQNQRSIFSFLNSAEPHGFQQFLSHASRKETYLPAMLWDYLRDNLEPSILASPDGHRWSTAVEAFERCESRGGTVEHLMIAKTIAVIEQFREHAGFYPSKDVLSIATSSMAATTRTEVLKDLEQWSIVVYRRHLGAYAIHSGSDFEIETAIDEERNQSIVLDYMRIRQLAGLQPIVAKRHYHQTGAMHWVDVDVVPIDEVETRTNNFSAATGSLGLFVVALPSRDVSAREAEDLLRKVSRSSRTCITAGLAPNGDLLLDLAQELTALERIRVERAELSGDAVARREVDARLDATKHALESALYDAFLSMSWYKKGKPLALHGLAEIHRYASALAATTYPNAPQICNELLNRAKPSSTAVAARRLLMRAMVNERGKDRLGIDGYPAEAGLFTSLLETTGLYGRIDRKSKHFGFKEPANQDPCNVGPLWTAADALLNGANNEPIALTDILDRWRTPPYGVRDGLLPVLALAYMLSRVDRLAFYLDGAFRPSLDDFLVDRMHQEAVAVQIRQMDFGKLRSRVLHGIRDLVAEHDGDVTSKSDPLVIARRLVAIVIGLPGWAQRTASISNDAQRLRSIVTSASDPHRFLFDDLPGFASDDAKNLTERDIDAIVASIRAGLQDLVNAYPNMLAGLDRLMLSELNAVKSKKGRNALSQRAKNVHGLSGDFRLDAFTSRLMSFTGTREEIEGIASLAANKPPRDWVDRDLDAAQLQIAKLSQQFNRCEAFARVKGRADRRHAIAFVVGMPGSPKTMVEEFEIEEDDRQEVAALAEDIRTMLPETSQARHVALAALAQVGAELLSADAVKETAKPKVKQAS